MLKAIIDILNAEIIGVSWVDKLGGITQPLKLKKMDGENLIEKVIPVAYNYSKTTCDVSDYVDYTPDTRYKSVCYWEIETQPREVNTTARYAQYEAVIRFVGWLNLGKINKSLTPPTELINDVLAILPQQISNSTPFVFCQGRVTQIGRDSSIFDKYTYEESESQYLIYPFDYFAIDYTVSFRVPFACITPVSLDPSPCLL